MQGDKSRRSYVPGASGGRSRWVVVVFSSAGISIPIKHQLELSYIHPVITCPTEMILTMSTPPNLPEIHHHNKRTHQIISHLFSLLAQPNPTANL